jgi:hypothetical protein
MPLFLTIVGWGFVAFGGVAWAGLAMDRPPALGAFGARPPAQLPSAIQETPIFLAIGFGFVLIAAGAILRAIQASGAQIGALREDMGRGPRAMSVAARSEAMPAAHAAPTGDIPAEIAELVARAESQGWRIEPQAKGGWQATRRGHTQVFQSVDEFRDWLAGRTR